MEALENMVAPLFVMALVGGLYLLIAGLYLKIGNAKSQIKNLKKDLENNQKEIKRDLEDKQKEIREILGPITKITISENPRPENAEEGHLHLRYSKDRKDK